MSILINFVFAALPFTSLDSVPPPIVAEPQPPKEVVIKIYDFPEEFPLFPVCQDVEIYIDRKRCADTRMLDYLYSELKYPEEAKNNHIEGTAIISFVVDEQGNLTNLRSRKKVGGGCEEEALRVVQKMAALPQKWLPGKHGGKKVKVNYNLPIRFNLQS